MLSSKEKNAVRDRLKALFDIIYIEAINNPDFFRKIEDVLLSSEARLPKVSKTSKPPQTPEGAITPLISILHEKGVSGLHSFLEEKSIDELVKICAKEGIKKSKEAKGLSREDLILLMMEVTEINLNQGTVF